jgi:hypothetical protein
MPQRETRAPLGPGARRSAPCAHLRDLFPLGVDDARARVAGARGGGELFFPGPFAVEGWSATAYSNPPPHFRAGSTSARARLSLRTHVVWERSRLRQESALFDFATQQYEFYSPAEKRDIRLLHHALSLERPSSRGPRRSQGPTAASPQPHRHSIDPGNPGPPLSRTPSSRPRRVLRLAARCRNTRRASRPAAWEVSGSAVTRHSLSFGASRRTRAGTQMDELHTQHNTRDVSGSACSSSPQGRVAGAKRRSGGVFAQASLGPAWQDALRATPTLPLYSGRMEVCRFCRLRDACILWFRAIAARRPECTNPLPPLAPPSDPAIEAFSTTRPPVAAPCA